MKIITVQIKIFEEGDRVITPDGIGNVLKDTRSVLKEDNFYEETQHSVHIQHDVGSSNNPNNEPVEMECCYPMLLKGEKL